MNNKLLILIQSANDSNLLIPINYVGQIIVHIVNVMPQPFHLINPISLLCNE